MPIPVSHSKPLIDAVLRGEAQELSIGEIQQLVLQQFGEWFEYHQIYHVLEGENTEQDYSRTITTTPHTYKLLC